MDAPNPPRSTRLKRLAWFVLIWAASVATLALVAWGLRSVLMHASR